LLTRERERESKERVKRERLSRHRISTRSNGAHEDPRREQAEFLRVTRDALNVGRALRARGEEG
jgi:hypothetical protein